jgi:ribulose-phosphate 3-epimerase
MPEIVPTILSNDISDFRKKYSELLGLAHHFSSLHVDFIDGEYIENKTLLPKDLGFLKSSHLNLIAHFMALRPQRYFLEAKNSGFKTVIAQFEAFANDKDVEFAILEAKKLGLQFGLAINPETPLHNLGKFIREIGLILLMSVKPGAQGREFILHTLDKIKEAHRLTKHLVIAVDGGIKVGIARQCALAGADVLVTGSAILRAQHEEEAVEALVEDVKI